MTRDEFLRRIAAIRVWSKDGRRAPHKPLLLLWALARVARDEPRLANFENDVEEPVRGLLDRFGHPRREPRPQYPFCRLVHDGIWETPGTDGLPTTTSGDIHVSALKEHGISGGFLDSVNELLRGEPEVVEIAASLLLAMHFPPSLQLPIRDALELPPGLVLDQVTLWRAVSRRPRDSAFRPAVLDAYEYRCAVCDFDIRLEEDLIGVDAAHIWWHCNDGPDTVSNGLALCKVHHHALDAGAIGLSPSSRCGLEIVVSDRIRGISEPFRQLLNAAGQPIRRPQQTSDAPGLQFVEWHRENVFRGEPRLI